MNKNKIILPIISIIIFVFALSFSTKAEFHPPSIHMFLSSDKVMVRGEVELKIAVSAYDPINAFDITLSHPQDLLEFVRARTDRSIASIWKSFPLEDKNGEIRIIGGMTSPFSGDNGEIITLIYRGKALGIAELTAERADLALADGKGTLLSGGMGRLQVNIIEGESIPTIPASIETAPKISDVIITEDPQTRDSLVLVRTENDGGVKEVQMRTRDWFLWSDWQKSELLASVPKYVWAVELKAVGFDDTESNTVLYRWHIILIKLFSVFALIALMFYANRPFYRLWKKSKSKNL